MSARRLANSSGDDDSKSEEDGTSVDGTSSSSGGVPELFYNYNYRHRMSMRFYDQIMARTGDALREKKVQTGLHLEMHREMVQATFTLMKRVIVVDSKLECRKNEITVEDFRTAYDLIHDWYPQLRTVGPAFRAMWQQSKVEMLQALSRLAKQEVLPGQDKCHDFEAWVESELAEAVLDDDDDYGRKFHPSHAESGRSAISFTRMARPMHEESDLSVLRAHCHHNLLAMHALMSQGETRTHQHVLTNIAKNASWLLYMVLVTDTFVLYESACLGLLMQFFLDLNIQHMGDFIFHSWGTVVSAPMIVVVCAALGSNFLELTKDALNDPPFKNTCAHFLVVGETCIQHHSCFHHKTWWRMLLARSVDFFFTYLLGILIGLGLLKWGLGLFCDDQTVRSRGFLNGYMHGAAFGGLFWVFLAWIAYGLCWLYNSTDYTQRNFATTNLMQVLIRCIQGYGIRPGTYTRFFLTVSRHLELAEEDDVKKSQEQILAWVDKENARGTSWKEYALKLAQLDAGLHTSRHCEGWALAVGAFVMWPLIYLIFVCGILKLLRDRQILDTPREHIVAVWLCSILVCVAVLVTGGFVCRLMPKMNNMIFRSHVVIFSVVSIFMTCLSTFPTAEAASTLDVVVWANDTGGFYNDPYKDSGAVVNSYPVCSNVWGESNSMVDIMDLALLSWYSYEKDPDSFAHLVRSTFVPSVEIINVTNFVSIPRVAVVRIPDEKRPQDRGTVVIAVKGTSTMAEAFADMGMYTTMVSLQMADKIAPLLHTFPTSIIAQAIGSTAVPFSRKSADQFLNKLGTQVNITRSLFPRHRVVLTGHSLGGGLAEVVGAQLDVPAVVFSAPGNVFLTKALSIPKPKVYKNIIGVMPDDDVVPSIDDHADMVQHIQCIDREGNPRASLACHGMLATLCELWRVCGDRYKRNFFHTCVNVTQNVHPACIGQRFGAGGCPR